MGIAKEFLNAVAKEKLAVYFLLFWAGSFFFWALRGMWTYGFGVEEVTDALAILANIAELVAGVVLALLALKFLKSDFLGALSKEKLLAYFVLLWAGAFFFWALYDIVDYGPWVLEYAQDAVALIGALFDLAAGAVLALLGWKLLTSKESNSS